MTTSLSKQEEGGRTGGLHDLSGGHGSLTHPSHAVKQRPQIVNTAWGRPSLQADGREAGTCGRMTLAVDGQAIPQDSRRTGRSTCARCVYRPRLTPTLRYAATGMNCGGGILARPV